LNIANGDIASKVFGGVRELNVGWVMVWILLSSSQAAKQPSENANFCGAFGYSPWRFGIQRSLPETTQAS
jgi:hypothetical protein